MFSSVPTINDVLVPETLLKKRKSQEKARAERTAEQDKKKIVRHCFSFTHSGGDMMHNTTQQLDKSMLLLN